MKTTIIHILIGLICFVSQVKAQNFPFHYLPPITIAPTEEANCMFFDKEGMMWVGTNAGVKSYDGYHVKPTRRMLTSLAYCPTIPSAP